MKFFHLSDLHIGKQLFQYNLYKEQEYLLKQVVDQVRVRKPDAILISGDVYDKSVPSAEAVQIFDAFLTELAALEPAVPVLIIAGNHDSAKRLDYAKDILRRQNIHIVGTPPATKEEFITKVTIADSYGPVNFYLLPFMKPGHVRGIFEEADSYSDAVTKILQRENINLEQRNVLLTHQFYVNGSINPERSDSEMVTVGSIDSVDVSAVEMFDYVAMGHIHRMQHVRFPWFAYSGTLFPYSVSEADHEKGILEVELHEKNTRPMINRIAIKGLRAVARLKGMLEEVVSFSSAYHDDYVSIVLTDEIVPYEAKDVLESYFSNILEIRFDNQHTKHLMKEIEDDVESTDPLELFQGFFEEIHQRTLNEDEQKALSEAIQAAIELEV